MQTIKISNLNESKTLDRQALRLICGGVRFGGFGWIRPYQEGGSQSGVPITIVNYYINELKQVINNNMIMTSINIDASGNTNSDINLEASPVQVVNQNGSLRS